MPQALPSSTGSVASQARATLLHLCGREPNLERQFRFRDHAQDDERF